MIDFLDRNETLAYALGIPLYDREGRLYQHGPGRRIDPADGAKPRKHGAPAENKADPTTG